MAKKKLKAENILKVVDIYIGDLSKETVDQIKERVEPTYLDTNSSLSEHLYSPESLEQQLFPNKDAVMVDQQAIITLCTQRDAGYFRIVKSV